MNYIWQCGVNASTTLMRRVCLHLLVCGECKMMKVIEKDPSYFGRAVSVYLLKVSSQEMKCGMRNSEVNNQLIARSAVLS